MQLTEPAPAKLNLALHVRGKLPEGRHRIETIFAFCTDGDHLVASAADDLTFEANGPFAGELGAPEDNLVMKAARALRAQRADPVAAVDDPVVARLRPARRAQAARGALL